MGILTGQVIQTKTSKQYKMEYPLRCYVCDNEINTTVQRSVFDIKSRHSGKPIAELLKRLQNGDGTLRAHSASNACVLCDECIEKINAYDEAYQLAERIEKQLKEMIVRTKERYENVKDPIEIHWNEKSKSNRTMLEVPDGFAVDTFESVERVDPTFENKNEVVIVSEQEEEIESEVEDIDSDDSFVWPKNGAFKRKRETGEQKQSEIYKCIECPADFREKYEMQVKLSTHCFSHYT